LGWRNFLGFGLTTPKPVELPREGTLAPVESRFWNHIADNRSGDWFYLLNTGEEALAWRLNAIDSATVSIDMETFLWKPDDSGLLVLQHIIAAADRGVRVRILLDDSFTMHEDLALHATDEHPNIEYRIYNPFKVRQDNVVLRQLFALGEFSRTDHRMHNKTLVIDGRSAIIGGRNIADEYFGNHEKFNFRDLEVIAFGGAAMDIGKHFDTYWNNHWSIPIGRLIKPKPNALDLAGQREWLKANAPRPKISKPEQLQRKWLDISGLAASGSQTFFSDRPADRNPGAASEAPNQLAVELLAMIDKARDELVLVTAYLIPTPELEAALERAEARGVEVRILTNSLRSNNHLAAHSAYRGHMHQLLSSGVNLHEVRAEACDRGVYMRRPVDRKRLGLHAKLLLIDHDQAFIGSCNLDPRSFKINTEVGLIIESPELNHQLRELLALDFHPGNAWLVRLSSKGKLVWIGENDVQHSEPADSQIQRLEDWFLGMLPIDEEM
jgi:putative cardiolipin synthase